MEKLEKFQLLISCALIALGILLSSLVFASRMQKNENITVTGSASKIVKSDSASFSFTIALRAPNQKDAFNAIKKQTPVVVEYLKSKGIEDKDMEVKAVGGYYNYKRDARGYTTDEYAFYNANQSFSVKSKDVEKIKEISTDIQNLVNKGINLDYVNPPTLLQSKSIY